MASKDVVLDWNVPPDGIPFVERARELGFETWRFDGDRDTGRQVFLNRPDHPATVEHYTRYMAGVERDWSRYQSLFEDRYLDVLRPGPIFMPNEERLALIEAYRRHRG